jgi:S-adenosyl methyltransferase
VLSGEVRAPTDWQHGHSGWNRLPRPGPVGSTVWKTAATETADEIFEILAAAGDVAVLATGLASGGFLAISHLTRGFAADAVTAGWRLQHARPGQHHAPNHAGVAALFGRLSLVPPRVVPATGWRSGSRDQFSRPTEL